LKLLVVSNTAWSIRKFRLGLVRGLQSHGCDVTAVAPADTDTASLPCEFIPIQLDRSSTNPVEDLRLFGRLKSLYRLLAPDAILHFTSKPNIYGAVAAGRLGIPSIANITGLGSAFIGGGPVAEVQRQLYRYALRFPRVVFFQNPEDRQMFVRRGLVHPDRAELLPGSGIDLTEFSPRPGPHGGRFVFLMIARLILDKGIREYVEAARILLARGVDAECRVVGFIDERNPSGVKASEFQAWIDEGAITFLGRRNDVREEIARAGCVVLPSYREGTPRTLLEAAAMARPIVTTDVPGCREVVEDQQTGLLCRPGDSQDLAEKMDRLFRLSPAERVRLGRNGRAKMEREFNEQIVVARYLEALRKVVA
jgi:glycosyltransferase involved in cell wall biosynthesis